ncbi:hypothetical protein SAMN05421539_105229 [Jannaschia seohaensis]|uniref:Uncharacterized protein n=1 Tax=Jannaschia seohaensis TaxID=475081 RepID=A0A2Y9ARP7_9RHOB|nr:hypothetical protein BCF38_105229 [Jannaschia seohaensis]SSA46766.1 hypothetical protein SAMN05421539_105229 [Jannaschia seohaensis]
MEDKFKLLASGIIVTMNDEDPFIGVRWVLRAFWHWLPGSCDQLHRPISRVVCPSLLKLGFRAGLSLHLNLTGGRVPVDNRPVSGPNLVPCAIVFHFGDTVTAALDYLLQVLERPVMFYNPLILLKY